MEIHSSVCRDCVKKLQGLSINCVCIQLLKNIEVIMVQGLIYFSNTFGDDRKVKI